MRYRAALCSKSTKDFIQESGRLVYLLGMPINKLTPYRHSDKSINISLYYLRAQIINDGLDGLAHADALSMQRDCDPGVLRVPPKRIVTFRHGEFRRAVMDALRDGAKSPTEN